MKTLYALKDERGNFLNIFKNDSKFLPPELLYRKELAEYRAKIYAEKYKINLKVVKVKIVEIEDNTDISDNKEIEDNRIYRDFMKGLERGGW